ncbi:hypothetical protein BGX24_009772 [Mortierella sp. AD032]|nr:hypothetical protein BGX24_009772 [Mortierella sp. AD032]
MATVHNHHNHIDASPSITSAGGNANPPWLSTYSRALSSIYGTDEDHCWDYLLSSSLDSPTTTSRSNTPANNTNNTNTDNNNINNNNAAMMASTLAPLSPASLSHALCKFGFDCIDYFTATQLDDDDDDNNTFAASRKHKPQTPTSSPSPTAGGGGGTTYPPVYTNPMLDELTESDWRTGLAAAVCGKRTAALERKRVLSRTMSQDEFLPGGANTMSPPIAPLTASNIAAASAAESSRNTDANDVEGNTADRRRKRDPWFEALDRLARWDEVAYR